MPFPLIVLRQLTRNRAKLRGETVVLVHGLAATGLGMKPLQLDLRSGGYQTVTWRYPSVWQDIRWHARDFSRKLEQLQDKSSIKRFHLVTHSMGGILARYVLSRNEFPKLRRMVMLAPPNRGSWAATVASIKLPFCKPLRQIADDPDSFVNRLERPAGVEIGIIAGSRDRLVRVSSTRLPGAADHIVLPAGHNSLLFRRETAKQVEAFLKKGKFRR